jgi:ribonuclease HI
VTLQRFIVGFYVLKRYPNNRKYNRFSSVWPAALKRLLNFYRRKQKEIVILADTNSHSSLWGCPENNRRGDKLEDLIFAYDLTINNVGEHCTFFNRRCATIIDVTLSSQSAANYIQDWRVDESVEGSDHHFIRFDWTISANAFNLIRNYEKGDWPLFQRYVEDASTIDLPVEWNVSVLNEQVDTLHKDIAAALDKSHPLHKVRGRIKAFHWWNDELKLLQEQTNHLASFNRSVRTDDSHEELVEARKNYRHAIRRAKRKTWQQFTSEVSEAKHVARIHRIINNKGQETLGLLKKNGLQCLPEETMETLMDEHFPGSYSAALTVPTRMRTPVGLAADFFNHRKVKKAIDSFGDRKAPGPDGLHPIVLKNLGTKALLRLTGLYRASLHLGYVPLQWRKARVIFIPKPGKATYEDPRSFRPITLSSFMIKTMERVVAWHLEETSLRTSPLSDSQHAFRKGRSTESALSNMTEYIEYALANGEYALGVFLDIQGAFDNVKPSSIVQGMKDKGIDSSIIKWYNHYLRNRAVTVSYKGITTERRLTLGTPQGGVLSPLMWNLAFESFLDLFKTGPVRCCGYADDAGLVITGANPLTMQTKMQNAINLSLEWGQRNGLTFSASKTVCVLFNKKHKPVIPPKLTIGEQQLDYDDTVRYLGINLDSKLSMRPHAERVIKSAKAKLLMVKNAMGKLWGIPPHLMRWGFTGIVRPALAYGALVWAKVTKQEGIKTSLQRINRLALLAMGKLRHSTPTAGLEIICDIMPLDLFIKAEASSAYIRTTDTALFTHSGGIRTGARPGGSLSVTSLPLPKGQRSQYKAFEKATNYGHRHFVRGHLQHIDFKLPEMDYISPLRVENRGYRLMRSSFNKGTPRHNADYSVYTDGSKIQDRSGSGFCVFRDSRKLHTKSFHLPDTATVFQAEIYAIKKAAEWLLQQEPSYQIILIHIDSQAAILALMAQQFTSKLVAETNTFLEELNRNNFLKLRWVKAHVGHLGNEMADEAAKEGALTVTEMEGDVPKISLNGVKSNLLMRHYEECSCGTLVRLLCQR